MIPENRLETLLTQAQDFQKSSCVYHNVQQSELSLFEDHHCDRFAPPHGTIFLHALPLFEEQNSFFFSFRNQIPRQTLVTLEGHVDEVWFIEFSHDGKFLASASKDSTVIIWSVEVSPSLVFLGFDQTLLEI